MRVRRGATVINRTLSDTGITLPRREVPYCTWCREPVDEPRRRSWHSGCVVWYLASRGQCGVYGAYKGRMSPEYNTPGYDDYWEDLEKVNRCVTCGSTSHLEHEHHLGISVAVALGRKAVMVAFMPDNLRYLCHDCHVVKTKQDRVILSLLRGTFKPPPPPSPQMTLPGLTDRGAPRVT